MKLVDKVLHFLVGGLITALYSPWVWPWRLA